MESASVHRRGGIEYYDNASGKRTTRRFEVLTETRNGRITPVDITVK